MDFKNFAPASRRYTGDIHNSTVVGLSMTPTGQWKRLDRVVVECTFITHCPTVTLQLHNFDLFRTYRTSIVSALLRGNWQDFDRHDASRGPSAIAELLVTNTCNWCSTVTEFREFVTTILRLAPSYSRLIEIIRSVGLSTVRKLKWTMRAETSTSGVGEWHCRPGEWMSPREQSPNDDFAGRCRERSVSWTRNSSHQSRA